MYMPSFYIQDIRTQFKIHLCVGGCKIRDIHFKPLVYYYSIYCMFYISINSNICYTVLCSNRTVLIVSGFIAVQFTTLGKYKASIHPSLIQIAIALPFSLPSALDFQIRFQSVWLYSVAVRFPQSHRWVERVRDQYGTERGGKCFYTAVPMKHLFQEPLCSPFTACMQVFLYS